VPLKKIYSTPSKKDIVPPKKRHGALSKKGHSAPSKKDIVPPSKKT
jgi:hypothetical protein